MTTTAQPRFIAPSAGERVFNRMFGFFVGLGLAPGHMYLLEVRGRKSGKTFRTPVHLLDMEGKQFLVAPRGSTQWVRNAEAAGEIVLKRGNQHRKFRLIPISAEERPPYLQAYLDRFKTEVQRYFPVQAGSPTQAFSAIAENYPVFELIAA